VSKTLLEVDKLVNLAVMKTHEIPGVTMLHKQYVGTYMQTPHLDRMAAEGSPWNRTGFIEEAMEDET